MKKTNKWKALLFDMDHSIEESRALQGGYIHMIMIGILDSHDPEKFAMQSVRELKKKSPRPLLSFRPARPRKPVSWFLQEALILHLRFYMISNRFLLMSLT